MGPMDAVKGVREVAELVKKYNDLPLYEKLVDLQSKVTDQASDIVRLTYENQELQRSLTLKQKTRYEVPYYYQEGDDIPLCPKCFESSGETTRAHMSHPSADSMYGHGRTCLVCDTFVKEGARHKPLQQARRIVGRPGGWMGN